MPVAVMAGPLIHFLLCAFQLHPSDPDEHSKREIHVPSPCQQVASAMAHLESCSPPVLHRDLKPSNVLIDADGRAHVSDFGLCRTLVPGEGSTLTKETGTYMYMSPEMVRCMSYHVPRASACTCTRAGKWYVVCHAMYRMRSACVAPRLHVPYYAA